MTNRAPEPSWTIPSPGDLLAGKYVVDGVCGRGGLAVVLSAMHTGLGQRVAIKMLLPEWANEFDVVERFLREGRAATRIGSEHVVRVFDVGTLDSGAPYLVLEYLEGHNLDDVVAMWGPLQIPTAVDWVLQACEAISEAHALGIIHRDLKPGNLFVTRQADGSACVKVIDFGLSKLATSLMPEGSAKLTRPTDVMGSPHYMPPEQLRAMQDADARTDLWALGVVLFELLAGQTPFRGQSMAELCTAVLTRPPTKLSSLRPEVPPALEAAVHRCLAKDPAERFASAAELARAIAPFGTPLSRTSCMRIERILEGRASQVPPPAPPALSPLAEDWSSGELAALPGTHTSAKVILGSFLMLAGIGTGLFMWMYEAVHASDPERLPGSTMMQPSPPPQRTALIEVPPAPVAAPSVGTAPGPLEPEASTPPRSVASPSGSSPVWTPPAHATARTPALPAPRPRAQPWGRPAMGPAPATGSNVASGGESAPAIPAPVPEPSHTASGPALDPFHGAPSSSGATSTDDDPFLHPR